MPPAAPTVTLEDILAARQRISEGVLLTPCPESLALSRLTGMRIACKLDSLQRTGSFKERGARNALLLLDSQARQRGVIAASAGNHALGLAYHGSTLGIPVTVVMPRYAPLIKVATCRTFGARVILAGDTFVAARHAALELARTEDLTYIHGFDNPAIIAGQGTMALEILEQVPDLEAVIIPVGGAGLLAGMSVAIKTLRPEVRVIAVEDDRMPSFTAAIRAGHPVEVPARPTLADGLAVGKVGELSLALALPRYDELLQVSEDELALAILRLVELEKCVVEGSAAATLAAAVRPELNSLHGKRVVLVLCGGNIDLTLLGRVLERGQVLAGRLYRFIAIMPDRPGALAHLSQLIAATGANVRDIEHERAFADGDLATVHIACTVETTDTQQATNLRESLTAAGIICQE
ncbi:MAG: threonine ammonia-lyase [Pirellulales bacterium]|nr:threonine ammonia-lyase [Pirellulales bacterium]